MPLTLLQIINGAQAELGIPQSATVVGNTDPTTVQMLALANNVIDELRRMHPTGWSAMQFEFDLLIPVPLTTTGNISAQSYQITNLASTTGIIANATAVSGNGIPPAARVTAISGSTVTMSMESTNQTAVTGETILFAQDTYTLPTGFDWYQNRTMWDRTNRWELIGPASPQFDQWHKSGIVTTGPRRFFRQLGPYTNQFQIWPAPFEIATPLQFVFEYMSINAVSNQGGSSSPPNPPVYTQYFTNDMDTPLLDDQAIKNGIKWMFWEAKGFGSYVTLQNRWIDYVERQIGRDGAAETLKIVREPISVLINSGNVQDSGFPGPTGPNTG